MSTLSAAQYWLDLKVGSWRCRHGWHDWGYHALKDLDLCQRPLCGRQSPREASYEFASPDEVFGPLDGAEAALA